MKAAFVITLVAAINFASTVHTEDKNNIGRKQSHSSEGEGSQSLVISSRAKLTNENVSAAILPEPYEMDMLDGSELNEDESFVLVPLKNLVKNPRKPRDTTSEDEKDPLYVMIPYKELSRNSKDFGEPVNIIAMDDRIAVKRNTPHDKSNHSYFESSGQKRKERSIARPRRLFKRKKIYKRFFKYPSFKNHEGDANIAKVADSEALWEVPLSKYLSNGANPYALARTPKATYKSKKSLGVNELRNQLAKELSTSNQKPRVFTEFRDLNPKSKDIRNIMSKQRKASNSPVNITMYITNLIPPNEVDNTRITNSGKLFKSGCLKFSIQLEKPAGLCPDDCCADECCNHPGCSKTANCTLPVPQRVGCGHIERVSDEKSSGAINAAMMSGNPTPGSPAGSPAQGCWQNSNILENSQLAAAAYGKAPAVTSTEAPCKIESNPAANRDVTSLLMQLMGLEKKPARKPVLASPAQAVLMDSDIVKELQRLLTSNQGSTPATGDSFKANYAAGQTQSPMTQHNPKAKAIADALNLFSKFTSMRQPII